MDERVLKVNVVQFYSSLSKILENVEMQNYSFITLYQYFEREINVSFLIRDGERQIFQFEQYYPPNISKEQLKEEIQNLEIDYYDLWLEISDSTLDYPYIAQIFHLFQQLEDDDFMNLSLEQYQDLENQMIIYGRTVRVIGKKHTLLKQVNPINLS